MQWNAPQSIKRSQSLPYRLLPVAHYLLGPILTAFNSRQHRLHQYKKQFLKTRMFSLEANYLSKDVGHTLCNQGMPLSEITHFTFTRMRIVQCQKIWFTSPEPKYNYWTQSQLRLTVTMVSQSYTTRVKVTIRTSSSLMTSRHYSLGSISSESKLSTSTSRINTILDKRLGLESTPKSIDATKKKPWNPTP